MESFIHAIILGIIEGITEFLPISSTGHLILTGHALDFKDTAEVFTVVIQVGAIGAVLGYYRKDLWQRFIGLLHWQKEAVTFWTLLALGTIPAGIIGLALDSSMEHITTPAVIAWALIIGGIILWIVDRKPRGGMQAHGVHKQEDIDFSQITLKRALAIGAGQCVAIIPGVSRSGATIVSGLLSGLNRPTATAFSFYLSIPVLVMASAYKLVKHGDAIQTIPGGVTSLILGILFSFVTAWLAIAWLLKFIATHDFRPFAYYRIGFGIVLLILLGVGVIE